MGTRLAISTVCVVPAVLMGLKMDMWFRPLADGQKGDNRLMTLKEIQQIYPQIPETKTTFPGYGGIPITHYKNIGTFKQILLIRVLLVPLDQGKVRLKC